MKAYIFDIDETTLGKVARIILIFSSRIRQSDLSQSDIARTSVREVGCLAPRKPNAWTCAHQRRVVGLPRFATTRVDLRHLGILWVSLCPPIEIRQATHCARAIDKQPKAWVSTSGSNLIKTSNFNPVRRHHCMKTDKGFPRNVNCNKHSGSPSAGIIASSSKPIIGPLALMSRRIEGGCK